MANDPKQVTKAARNLVTSGEVFIRSPRRAESMPHWKSREPGNSVIGAKISVPLTLVQEIGVLHGGGDDAQQHHDVARHQRAVARGRLGPGTEVHVREHANE